MDQVYIRRHSTALSHMLAVVYAMSLAPLPTVGLLGGWLRRRLALHAVRLVHSRWQAVPRVRCYQEACCFLGMLVASLYINCTAAL